MQGLSLVFTQPDMQRTCRSSQARLWAFMYVCSSAAVRRKCAPESMMIRTEVTWRVLFRHNPDLVACEVADAGAQRLVAPRRAVDERLQQCAPDQLTLKTGIHHTERRFPGS